MTVAIAGIAELPHGKPTGEMPMQRHERLIRQALDDAGCTLADVDVLMTVAPRSDPYLIHAAAVAEYLRIRPAQALTIEAGGPGAITMLEMARGFIDSGQARVVVVMAADMPLGSGNSDAYVKMLAAAGPVHPDLEVPFAPSVPSMFALVARHHMHEYGLTAEQLASVALQCRRAAAGNPHAHAREPVSLADYFDSPMIADPLRRLDCAPVTNGGGALVLTSLERARDLRAAPVRLGGTGFSTGHLHLSTAPDLDGFSAGLALDRALGAAGTARDAIDLALVYDCFTIAMLVNLEDLGFVGRGESGPAFAAGAFGPSARVPVNPHGGLLSHGHPGRGAGFGNLVEAVLQLRKAAGPRQLPRAETALVHAMGGVFATHGVALLEAA